MEEEKIITPEENNEFSLDDLAEFGSDSAAITLDEEKIELTEDLEGFAKGFPEWDLRPPKGL